MALSDPEKLVDDLHFLNHALRTRRNEAAEVLSGVTARQILALHELAHAERLSVKELGARLGLGHSTVSGIVDRLEARGLVAREVDASDHRITRIRVSDPVRVHIDGAMARHYDPIVSALSAASPGEAAKATEGLAALRRILEAKE